MPWSTERGASRRAWNRGPLAGMRGIAPWRDRRRLRARNRGVVEPDARERIQCQRARLGPIASDPMYRCAPPARSDVHPAPTARNRGLRRNSSFHRLLAREQMGIETSSRPQRHPRAPIIAERGRLVCARSVGVVTGRQRERSSQVGHSIDHRLPRSDGPGAEVQAAAGNRTRQYRVASCQPHVSHCSLERARCPCSMRAAMLTSPSAFRLLSAWHR
jgi:hypothetical protein